MRTISRTVGNDYRKRQPGFTLIELLVVISIIALLMAILLPALSAAREEGKIAKCSAELHGIGVGTGISQNEYNSFFPMWDDGERSTINDRIIATWIDAMKHRKILSPDVGYCPSDERPDFLNAQRGAAWNFKYPPPQSRRGNVGGCDYSFGISIPLASGAHISDDSFSIGGVVHSTRALLQRNIDRRVLAGDAFWDWIHNMSGFGLKFNQFDAGGWFMNTAGYRHGLGRTRSPSADFLFQDLHVERVKYDISRFNVGVDTTKAFITYPGEPLNIYPALGTGPTGSAPCENFPKDIDPYEITGPDGAVSEWDVEIRMRKGWDS